ncbi:UDP-N-acetylmuramate dehydrogenase [bacterium]|nr:UDP-N-acetylmuramate dehydrogenase [bacterium]
MIIEHLKSLKDKHTFHCSNIAKYFITISDVLEIENAIDFAKEKNLPLTIIGDGANFLFTKEIIDSVFLKIENKKIFILDNGFIKAYAGVDWDYFVQFSLENSFYGLENLSGVPGTVGASAVQNIGAYGVEVSEFIHEVEVFDIFLKKQVVLDKNSLNFGYRDSIFKKNRGKYIVLSVTYRLFNTPKTVLTYRALLDSIGNCSEITPKKIRETVLQIRDSKLPNPKNIGNAGSFFKNPEVERGFFESLKEVYSDIPFFLSGDLYKIPAAWLIEKSGWKGFRDGSFGVHEKHALILVNYGDSKGADIYSLATKIIKSVEERFGITLQPEVEII